MNEDWMSEDEFDSYLDDALNAEWNIRELQELNSSQDGLIATEDDWLNTLLWIYELPEAV